MHQRDHHIPNTHSWVKMWKNKNKKLLYPILDKPTFWKIDFNSLGSPRLVDCTYRDRQGKVKDSSMTRRLTLSFTRSKHDAQFFWCRRGDNEKAYLNTSTNSSKQFYVRTFFGETRSGVAPDKVEPRDNAVHQLEQLAKQSEQFETPGA